MSSEWNVIQALRHTRHDWMNRLQLIKGNLDLDRVERAKEVIYEIVQEAQNESKLSNLKLPQFTEWVLTYNWDKNMIHIEYEILQDSPHKLNDIQLVTWFSDLFQLLENSVKPYAENVMIVTMDFSTEEVCFEFDFNGIIKNSHQLENQLQELKERNAYHLDILQMNDNMLLLKIKIKYI
ncbi:Spo0B C-terminal domain-containing protein [Rossellomorea sp. BNER]|uniref:Spo0B C-terminal domain-containing protein n=1 Tax=Rossellomorea sp. BNER TaxID=2962031 RepID=UPI003AF2082A|nr:sporulation initiation phosphotransferase B [Rossellomorea sp. BNER]